MRKVPIVFIFLSLACMQFVSAGDLAHGSIAIDVMDPRSEITQNINDRLLLRLRSVGDHEWEVQVNDRPTPQFPKNLLYEGGHGPHPSQIYAWNVASRRFPNRRSLCVPGHPYEVVIRLKDVETRHQGQDVFFVHGKIEVEWFKKKCE